MRYRRCCAACMKTKDIFLDALVLAGNASVLTQMIEPGIMLEKFDIAAGHGNILEDAPGKCTIAPPNCAERLDCLQESFALVYRNLVFDSDQYGAAVFMQLLRSRRMGSPMIRWRQVGRFLRAQAESADKHRCRYSTGSRQQQCGGYACLPGNPAPQQAAERHTGGEDHDIK